MLDALLHVLELVGAIAASNNVCVFATVSLTVPLNVISGSSDTKVRT